jgi:hypothetical protein
MELNKRVVKADLAYFNIWTVGGGGMWLIKPSNLNQNGRYPN